MPEPTKPTVTPMDLAGVCDSISRACAAMANVLAAGDHWREMSEAGWQRWAASPPAEPAPPPAAPDLHAALVVALVASTGLTAREVTAEGRTAYSVGVSFDTQEAMHAFYQAAAALVPPRPTPWSAWLEGLMDRARAL